MRKIYFLFAVIFVIELFSCNLNTKSTNSTTAESLQIVVGYDYRNKKISSIKCVDNGIEQNGYTFKIYDHDSNTVTMDSINLLVDEDKDGYYDKKKWTVKAYNSSGNCVASTAIESVYVGRYIEYARVSTYVFYIGTDTYTNNITIYAVDPMPISEKYNGLEWGADGKYLSINKTRASLDACLNIGYGVKNSSIILDSNGELQFGKEKALIPENEVSKTIWYALREIKKSGSAEQSESLKAQTVNGYGWFIPSWFELRQIAIQKYFIDVEGGTYLDISKWQFTSHSTSSSTASNSTLSCWSSSENSTGINSSCYIYSSDYNLTSAVKNSQDAI